MTARRMVDGGMDVEVGRLMGELPGAVLVIDAETPRFVLRYDPALLKLRTDEAPDDVRWPDLSGVEVRVVTDGMVPVVAARLVAVLLDAGADRVVELDIANTEPYVVRTHDGGGR